MDMTPMVDVTFLLLIFFMVTAAYSLQKSLELPSPDPQEEAAEARTLEELEADADYVIVRIGRDNTVWVNEVEAPSQQEVLYRLREARSGGLGSPAPRNLLVLADPAARHETVVMVLDAGNAVGMENIRLACIEEEAL
jgi:biopolymer transport protein ExbD